MFVLLLLNFETLNLVSAWKYVQLPTACILAQFFNVEDATKCANLMGGQLGQPMFDGTWYPILCENRTLCRFGRVAIWKPIDLYVVLQHCMHTGIVDREVEYAGERWVWVKGEMHFVRDVDKVMVPMQAQWGSDYVFGHT